MLIVHAAFKWCTEILMKKTVICMNHISFQIGLVLGIGGIVNLFIMFIEQEFSLMWLLFSLVLIIGSDRWLRSKTTLRSEELKEIYWAKHGVWSVGIVVSLLDRSNIIHNQLFDFNSTLDFPYHNPVYHLSVSTEKVHLKKQKNHSQKTVD